MEEKWIEVFKTGTHTDSSGNTKKWTTKDLDRIVSNYAARKTDSPAVIGHPKSNSPAYGWVMELKRDGDLLLAKVKPTVKEFVEWVRKKLYKHVSISLRPDLSLRHVGFLGAAAPAVKGLKEAEFAEEEFVEIEVPATDMSETQTKEDQTMSTPSEKEFTELKKNNEELTKAKEKMEKEFEELKEKNKKLESDFQASEEERAEARKNLKKLRMNIRKNEFEQFLNQEVAWGAIGEDQKNTALKILEFLDGEQFAEEGEDESEEVKLFKEFLKKLPAKTVPGEVATRTDAAEPTEKSKEFEEKIAEYMKGNDGVDYKEAVIAVAKKNPELYKAAQG